MAISKEAYVKAIYKLEAENKELKKLIGKPVKYGVHKFKSREQKLSYLLDSLLTLFKLHKEDYSVVEESLKEIAETVKEDPSNYPVTVSLYRFLVEEEYL